MRRLRDPSQPPPTRGHRHGERRPSAHRVDVSRSRARPLDGRAPSTDERGDDRDRADAPAARRPLPRQHRRACRGRTCRRCGAAASTPGSSSSSATRFTPRPTSRSTARGGFVRRQATQWRALARLLPHTDVFHFSSGSTLVPAVAAVPDPAALPQEVGHPLPRLGHPRQDAGAARVRQEGGRRDRRQLRRDPLGARGRGDPAGDRPRARSRPRRRSDRARPVILHAPSSRRRKGTEHVIAAVEGLDADLEIVEGPAPRRGVRALPRTPTSSSTSSTPAGTASSRSSAWRSASRSSRSSTTRPSAARRRPSAPPCRSSPRPPRRCASGSARSSPTPPSDGAIGAASRAYVERVHDQERITDRLLDVYARL